MPIRIAVQIAPEHAGYPAIRRAVAAAEEAGADLIVNWDHFFPLGKDRTGRHFECWTMLGAWAEATSTAEIGAMVSCIGYRNPDLLADMARTVDHISGGRLVLGIGPGFRQWEFEEYGFAFATPGERVRQMADGLPRIKRRLAALNPPPVREMPVLMAGGGPKMLRLVAEHADIWHTFADGDDFSAKATALDAYCRELGRDPATIERSGFVHGSPDKLGPELLERGMSLFTVITSGPAFDLGELREWVAWRDGLA